VVKNKVAPPFRTAEFDMMAADGISYEGDVLDMAAEAKLVTRTGAWFRYGDMQLGQGREKTRDYLKEHPELVEELREKVAANHALASGKTAPKAAVQDEGEDGEEEVAPPDEG
jgi:recombination protein RecA